MRCSKVMRGFVVVDMEQFRVSPKATVAVVKLNSPSTRNALTVEMGEEFRSVVAGLNSREDVRCVVLTGEGGAFSAGGDAKFLAARILDSHDGNIVAMRDFYSRFLSLRSLSVPVVAAVNGHAIGAGMCVSLACDVRFFNKDARLSVNFSRLGIHPGMGATYFLPRLIGVSKASRLLLSGETISGQDASSLGLGEAVDPLNVFSQAIVFAQDIARSTSRIAVQELVQTLRRDDETELDVALAREASAQATCYAQGVDLAEALKAMGEKRSPLFC